MDKKQLERKDNIIKLINLLDSLEGRNKAESYEITIMFNLHNYFFPRNMEHSKHCVSCREKVFKRLKSIKCELIDELNTYEDGE